MQTVYYAAGVVINILRAPTRLCLKKDQTMVASFYRTLTSHATIYETLAFRSHVIGKLLHRFDFPKRTAMICRDEAQVALREFPRIPRGQFLPRCVPERSCA